MLAGAAAGSFVLRVAARRLRSRGAALGRLGGPHDRGVHARRGLVGEDDLGVDEPDRRQPIQVLLTATAPRRCSRRRSRARPGLSALRWSSATTSETPIRPPGAQHPEHLGQHRGLVGGQVDHAVGDHHIHRAVGQRHVLDGALHELHVRRAGLGRVRPGQGEHLVGHVHPVGEPRLTHPPRGQQHVDPAAGAQIQHASRRRGNRPPPAGCRSPRLAATAAAGSSLLLGGAVQGRPERGVDLNAAAAHDASSTVESAAARSTQIGLHASSARSPRTARAPRPRRAAYRSRTCSRTSAPTSDPLQVASTILDASRIADASTSVNAKWQNGAHADRNAANRHHRRGDCLLRHHSPATSSTSTEAEQLAHVFKALGDPTRVRLLSLIAATAERRSLHLRPHRTRSALSPANRLAPHETARRRRPDHPRTTRQMGLLPHRRRRIQRRRSRPGPPQDVTPPIPVPLADPGAV